jgi:serine/threonine protein kinase
MMDDENKIPTTEKVDIYSFGMVLYEIITNCLPFFGKTDPQVLKIVNFSQRRPIIPDDSCDIKLKELISKCWKHNPLERPTIVQILATLELI